jgi:hypothetical protein
MFGIEFEDKNCARAHSSCAHARTHARERARTLERARTRAQRRSACGGERRDACATRRRLRWNQ